MKSADECVLSHLGRTLDLERISISVLSEQDLAFFRANGYVVVPGVVPQENVDAVIAAIWEFLGMDPDDPNDWYRPPHCPNSMIEMYQHPAMWDTRQHPRIHQAFADIYGTHVTQRV